jgi:hypothetical protein
LLPVVVAVAATSSVRSLLLIALHAHPVFHLSHLPSLDYAREIELSFDNQSMNNGNLLIRARDCDLTEIIERLG